MTGQSAIQVDDISHLGSFRDHIAKNKVYNSVHQYNVHIGPGPDDYIRQIAMVRVLGIRCKIGQEDIATRLIAKIINHIDEFVEGEERPVKGFLGNLASRIELAVTNYGDPEQLVVSYVALTPMGELILDEDFEFMTHQLNTQKAVTLEEINDLLKD